MANKVAILDFGTRNISVYVGERGLNNTIRVIGMGVSRYSGFYSGKILQPDALVQVISKAVSTAEEFCMEKLTDLLVGVPTAFSKCECANATISFSRRHKITEKDVQALFDVPEFENSQDYELINATPVYFMLDNDHKLMDPQGQYSMSLNALTSYVFAKKSFTDYVRSVLESIGIKNVDFASIPLCETLELFSPEKRDNYVLLVDVGFATTSVSLACGDGILFMDSFSMGGANLTSAITKALAIDDSVAERIKRQINLSLAPKEGDAYEVMLGTVPYRADAKSMNAICESEIKKIAKNIDKALSKCKFSFPDYIPISITGGGIANIRGAKDVIRDVLGRNVEIVTPQMPLAEKVNLSTAWGLLNYAIGRDESENSSILDKFN